MQIFENLVWKSKKVPLYKDAIQIEGLISSTHVRPLLFYFSLQGQCVCKRFVQGQDCSECKPKTFNLSASNPFGCQECRCNVAGVIGGIEICDEETGKCLCKERVTSKRCEICKDGYYSLKQSNAFGCLGKYQSTCFKWRHKFLFEMKTPVNAVSGSKSCVPPLG